MNQQKGLSDVGSPFWLVMWDVKVCEGKAEMPS